MEVESTRCQERELKKKRFIKCTKFVFTLHTVDNDFFK